MRTLFTHSVTYAQTGKILQRIKLNLFLQMYVKCITKMLTMLFFQNSSEIQNAWDIFTKTCWSKAQMTLNPANIYFFKVNNRSTRKRCEICSKLTMIKTPERRQWCRSGVLIVNFEYISHLFLMLLLLNLNK